MEAVEECFTKQHFDEELVDSYGCIQAVGECIIIIGEQLNFWLEQVHFVEHSLKELGVVGDLLIPCAMQILI